MVQRLGSVHFSVTRHLRAPRRLKLKGPQGSSSPSPPRWHRTVEAQRGQGVHPPVPGVSAGWVEETWGIQATWQCPNWQSCWASSVRLIVLVRILQEAEPKAPLFPCAVEVAQAPLSLPLITRPRPQLPGLRLLTPQVRPRHIRCRGNCSLLWLVLCVSVLVFSGPGGTCVSQRSPQLRPSHYNLQDRVKPISDL